MEPLFTHNPLFASVLAVGAILWVAMEVGTQLKERKRFKMGAKREDRGSKVVLDIVLRLGVLLCVALAYMFTATTIVTARVFLLWLGVLLIYCGLALRFYAIYTLGTYFTTTVAIAPEQHVIDVGPYRLIRHPSYTGLLLILFGFGLCCTNWLSLLVIMTCAIVSLGYRIRVEEQVLLQNLGQPYRDYMRRTKRLIPFVL